MAEGLDHFNNIILIGGSAGGIAVLHSMIARLPNSIPFPIVIVQHLPKNPTVSLADLVQHWTTIPVCEIDSGNTIESGVIYIAPPDYHLLFDSDQAFALNVDDPVHWSRPSIDVLFESGAYIFRHRVVAILLTGANEDGAAGLKRIYEVGGRVIVQNPLSADAKTMPEAALKLVPEANCMNPEEIAQFLVSLASHDGGVHLSRSE